MALKKFEQRNLNNGTNIRGLQTRNRASKLVSCLLLIYVMWIQNPEASKIIITTIQYTIMKLQTKKAIQSEEGRRGRKPRYREDWEEYLQVLQAFLQKDYNKTVSEHIITNKLPFQCHHGNLNATNAVINRETV